MRSDVNSGHDMTSLDWELILFEEEKPSVS